MTELHLKAWLIAGGAVLIFALFMKFFTIFLKLDIDKKPALRISIVLISIFIAYAMVITTLLTVGCRIYTYF